MNNLAVAIPTRNRPKKLLRCLDALQIARNHIDFLVYVCDSSDTKETRQEVQEVCSRYSFVKHYQHSGKNAAAARNYCAKVADARAVISLDDDVYVEPESIKNLYNSYSTVSEMCVMSGSVAWGNDWSAPVYMRLIGYGRKVYPEELPSFLISAFFIYPKRLALAYSWNENIRSSEDRFMGAVWRSKNIQLLQEPSAKAIHDSEHNTYDVSHQESHIYANLFDSLIANPNLIRALSYEFLGFAAGAKLYFRRLDSAIAYIKAWIRGHKTLLKDWSYLHKYYKT